MQAEDYIVVLSDNKQYCFYSDPVFNIETQTTTKKIFKVKTITYALDEDFGSFIAKRKSIIPPDVELTVLDIVTNLCGKFIIAKYDNNVYNIDPIYLAYVGAENIDVHI